ncbi:hypothetical protein KKA14_04755 [bacterium]|nr:hypothetical protein [bacterium]
MMFIVMRMQSFEFEAPNFPIPIKVEAGTMIGYLPVYETREDALKDFPNNVVIEGRLSEGGKS